MTPIDIGGIVVAVIAAAGAWASQRAASRANMVNTTVASRLDAEKEAYERARAFDTETIKRQNQEISELRSDNESLRSEIKAVMARLERLERERKVPKLEEQLRDRLNEPIADD